MDHLFLVAVVLATLAFAWTNGFHDAANVVATPLATGAWTPRIGLPLAGLFNAAGGLLGVSLVVSLQQDLVGPVTGGSGLRRLLIAVLVAITWNLITWWWAMPSSSSHALLAALAGSGWAAGGGPAVSDLVGKVLLPALVVPLVVALVTAGLVIVLRRLLATRPHARTERRLRALQTVSASALAVGHGWQDAQRSAVLIVVALAATGQGTDEVPWWVRIAAAVALGLGTTAGGWRLIRTLGRGIAQPTPLTGVTAETVTALALGLSAATVPIPVSTTHVLVGSLVGSTAGERGPRAVRWAVVGRILAVAALTPVATAAAAAALTALLG